MLKQLLCGLVLLCSTYAANAAVIVQDFTIASKRTTVNSTMAFNLFDHYNTGGVLQSVIVELFARSSGTISVENEDESEGVTAVGTLSTNITLKLQDELSNLLNLAPTLSKSEDLGVYDGTTDYAGTSGTIFVFSNTNVKEEGTYTATSSSQLSEFLGTGQRNFIFRATATSNVGGSGNLATSIVTRASGDVRITYTYVSEAPVILLFIIGVGLIVMRQSRKQNV